MIMNNSTIFFTTWHNFVPETDDDDNESNPNWLIACDNEWINEWLIACCGNPVVAYLFSDRTNVVWTCCIVVWNNILQVVFVHHDWLCHKTADYGTILSCKGLWRVYAVPLGFVPYWFRQGNQHFLNVWLWDREPLTTLDAVVRFRLLHSDCLGWR